jgi:hypothetical protein
MFSVSDGDTGAVGHRPALSQTAGLPGLRCIHRRHAGGKVSTPTGDNAFLHELELTVRTELIQAETRQPEETAGVPIDEWLFDPADAQREEVGLRSLLGAVESLEDGTLPPG